MTRARLRLVRSLAVLLAGGTALATVPRCWHGRDAGPLYDGDREAQRALARGMDAWLDRGVRPSDLATGSAHFDGEWRFATYMMAAVGYAQTALAHPELTERHAVRMETCIERLLEPALRAFDRARWNADPLESFGTARDHAGYLGYLNLALSLHRLLDPTSRFAELNERITRHLLRRTRASPLGLLVTYPGEVYPVDNTLFIASVAVYDRATGQDHGAFLAEWLERLEARYRDPSSGLLYQRVHPRTGEPADAPRGSGTAFAAWALSFVDAETSGALYRAMTPLQGGVLGFGMTGEYPAGHDGSGDIDSGPVLFGYAVSTTGFMLGASRAHGDRATYADNYATAHLFGAPVDRDGARSFAMGGPVGDAMMFALLTARPAERGARGGGR